MEEQNKIEEVKTSSILDKIVGVTKYVASIAVTAAVTAIYIKSQD